LLWEQKRKARSILAKLKGPMEKPARTRARVDKKKTGRTEQERVWGEGRGARRKGSRNPGSTNGDG
jgi:hypothetical protein